MTFSNLKLYAIVIILIILAILIISTFFINGYETDSYVDLSIDPALQIVEIGKEFSINISIDPANNPITAAQFDLIFNGSVIEIRNIYAGDLLKQGGATTIFNSGALDNSRGTLINVWGLITMPGANVTSKGTLVTITMITLKAGNSPLEVKNIIISDAYGHSMRVHTINGTVEVME